jgi:ABC-type transport system involved in multi-copper enzyme maturation permease subunit
MPILEQGYEPYRGPISLKGHNSLPIAIAALKRNRRWYVWVVLLMSVLFGSGKEYAFMFFVYALPAMGVNDGPGSESFLSAFVNHPNLYSDMMATQTFWCLAMATVVGSGEIAEDMRTGAITFYMGRPVSRLAYVLGKSFAVSSVVMLVTFLPTLFLFTMQATFEGNWPWLKEHVRVPFAILGMSLLVCLFASGFVLGLSALVKRRRWATVTVVAVLVGLSLVSTVLAPPRSWSSHQEQQAASQAYREAKTLEERKAARQRLSDSLDPIGSGSPLAEWRALSPGATLAAAGRDLFGNPLPSNFPWKRHWIFAIGVPVILLGLLWRRVRAVEIVA